MTRALAGGPGETSWEYRARRWLEDPLRQILSAGALFSMVAAISASQLYLNWTYAGADASYWGILALRLLEWWLWALIVPVVVLLQRRLQEKGHGRWAVLAWHVGFATVWFGLLNALLVWLTPLVDPAAAGLPFTTAYLARAMLRLTTAWVIYGLILLGILGVADFVRRQALTRDLVAARQTALRSQIQPHFLFNTLNTVAALVRTGDRTVALETLSRLGDLLRRSLTYSDVDRVPLSEELDFLDSYLAIQSTRFGERLEVDMDIDPHLLNQPVPPFLLQPLVENAIRHGLDLDTEPGRILVRAQDHGATFWLQVVDNGGRLGSSSESESTGIGLRNLRSRLDRMGSDHGLTLRSTEGRQTTVTITLPKGRGHVGI